MATRVDQQRALAYAMGKGGRPMPSWVAANDDMRDEFERGRAAVATRATAADDDAEPRADEPTGTDDASGPRPGPVVPAARPARPDATEVPDDPGDDEDGDDVPLVDFQMSWAQAKREARDYGARHEELPPFLAAHASLRRAHKAGQLSADWQHPFFAAGD